MQGQCSNRSTESFHNDVLLWLHIWHPLQVRVLLSRPSHKQEGFSLRGSAVRAYTPYNPTPRDESWYFFLTEPSNNAVLAWTKVSQMGAASCCRAKVTALS